MKRQPLLLLLLTLWISEGCREKTGTEKHRLPTQIREKNESEEEERKGFKDYYEYMHKAAPDVDWRAMDQATRWMKYLAHLAIVSEKDGNIIEVLANGNLVGEWKEKGSNNQSGRIWMADLDSISGKLYCISDGGNVWRGNINGTGWTVLNDKLQFSAGMLRVIPRNSGKRIITAGGREVYYSDNDGTTWSPSAGLNNLSNWGYIKRALVAGNQGFTMYLLALEWDYNNWYAINSLYRSSDQGSSFQLIQSWQESIYGNLDRFDIFAPRYGNYDLRMLRNDSVFSLAHNASVFNYIGRINPSSSGYSIMTGFRNNALDYLYVASGNRVYKSTNGGASWTATFTFTNGPFSPYSFECSVSDPNVLYYGDIECQRSYNGSTNFNAINIWWEYYATPATKLHADIPAIVSLYNSSGQEITLVSTDGGLYISYDKIQSVQNLSLQGHNVSQYYSIYTDNDETQYIYAGSQDQGFQRSDISLPGILNFDQVISGDYGHIVSSDGGNSIWMVYPGFLDYYSDAHNGNSVAGWTFTPGIPFWMPPLMAHPNDPEKVYLAGGNLNGTGSHILEMTYNGSVITPVELPYDFQAASGGGNLSAMAFSPIDPQYRYVLTDNGKFFFSTDAGNSWTLRNLSTLGGHYLYGATLYASRITPGLLYAGGSGYSNPPVFKSTNHGQTWVPANTGLPSTHVFQLTANTNENLLFAATEVGPYVYVAAENKWYDMAGLGAPDQTYWSVEFVHALQTVRFGTYGRGIWDFEIQDPNVNIVTQYPVEFHLFPNPATSYIQVTGKGLEKITLIDMKGNTIAEHHCGTYSEQVNIQNLAPGMYNARIHSAYGTHFKKFIKLP